MNQPKTAPEVRRPALRQFGLILLCLLLCLGYLFRDGWRPGRTVFSNDGPLGSRIAQCASLYEGGWSGYWQDLNWLGATGPGATPSVSSVLAYACGPLIFSKIYAPFTLLFLGLSAWLCFRQWKLTPVACVLGGLAAAMNSDFLSTACWGVASQPLSFGLDFLALAALTDETSPRRWLRVALAGLAVGMGVMEAFDIGAIFSVVIAAYVLFQALAGEGAPPLRVARGGARLAIVALCAAFIAFSAVIGLVGTQIKGVAGMGQDAESKAQRWDEATMWSLPKAETLSLVVPGLFGFRMDTPEGGNYWGRIGRHGVWDRYFASGKQEPRPDAGRFFIRYSGGGNYAGVIVALIALWSVAQAFRKRESVFPIAQRKFIWFWSAVAFVGLLLAFGRFAPFYKLFYALPFASTMRNPAKFSHVVEWALVILFAYGVHGLTHSWQVAPAAAGRGFSAQWRAWWSKAGAFDRNWVKGSVIALAASLVGWLIYSASRERLVAYLHEVGFEGAMAGDIAGFSIRQAGWFVAWLALALSLLTLLLSGCFSGRRARAGSILLGLLLVVDLGRANVPWVVTWNWEQKYATNPVIDFLREKPYEHRAAVLPFHPPGQLGLLNQLYDIEWKQQLFQYYNIQSLDIVMMPRAPVDYEAFEKALFFNGTSNTLHHLTRRWQLTNTRYLLGAAGFLETLNRDIDPVQHRFRFAARFDIGPKPGVPNPTSLEELTAAIKPDGQYAVFEFTGALPRAKLFANWTVSTNDQATLTTLASADFDPERTVLVADQSVPNPLPRQSEATAGQASTNSAEFTSYAPRRIVLQAKAGAPSVLLLNDKFNPDWKVSVDGKPGTTLRCNYLMRGVYLPVGSHTVEFRFEPPVNTLYVSSAAVVIGLLLLGFVVFASQKEAVPGPTDTPSSTTYARQAK